jgi:translation elongation factor EF-4
MTDAIVTFIAALLAVASAYVVSQRTISRSGSRLKMDLEILDLATRVGLSASEREAILARTQESLRNHTDGAVRRKAKQNRGVK